MQMLFIIGAILAGLFSFSLALYLCEYKFQIRNKFAKVFAVTASGSVIYVTTMALTIMAVWPPYWPY